MLSEASSRCSRRGRQIWMMLIRWKQLLVDKRGQEAPLSLQPQPSRSACLSWLRDPVTQQWKWTSTKIHQFWAWATQSLCLLLVLVAKLCSILCDPMDSSPRGSSVHGTFQARILGEGGCHFFLQGIFLDQGSNLCLLRWQVDSLPLSHQGSPTPPSINV